MTDRQSTWTCPRCWHVGEGAELDDGTRSALCSWCYTRVGAEPPAYVANALRLARRATGA